MRHVDVLLNYVVHLPLTEGELKSYLSDGAVNDVSLISLAEYALRKQLTDFNDNIEIDSDPAIGDIVQE